MRSITYADVNLSALQHNLQVVRDSCPDSRIMAVVKANAYGHGVQAVAKALSGADGFAVARLQEAMTLRASGFMHRILLLGTLLDEEALSICSRENIDVTAHDEFSVARIAAGARSSPIRVWLKLDCGMHRLGLDLAAFQEADRVLSTHPGVLELIHMTHFSSAANPDVLARQLENFRQCRRGSSQSPISLANSAALLARPETHGDWVRPGIALYGENPFGVRHRLPVRAAMTLRSTLIARRTIGARASVGYDAGWTSARPSLIGTIGIGYGDGYPRHAKNGTPVRIGDRVVPLVGRISMDSLTVDLTECDPVSVGDEATLWGPELPASEVAAYADTTSYELFTSLTERVPREYRYD